MAEDTELRRSLLRWENTRSEVQGAWKERRRLATAMRTVIARLIESDAPESELSAAADALERYAERLATHPRPHPYEGWSETSPAGNTGGFFDHSPLIGLSNPLAPPVELRAEPDGRTVRGRAIFGVAYEGPPGCLHGGYVAAAFDEVLGFANALSGTPGMTGSLTVKYRRPTPLHTELRFEATYDRTEGRKIFCSGKLFAGDSLCAEAEGLFVAVPVEKFRALFEERQKRERGGT